MVYASSAAVYGDAATVPIAEATERRPLSAYGADKLGCELHARVASHVHGIPTVGLRFFNVYGPRQDPRSPYSGVISIFCERIRRGAPIDIFGDGGQTRDFVYVADVVAALLAAMRLRARRTRRCSTSAPASRPRCWTWRALSPSSPARGSTCTTGRRAPAKSATPPARRPCRAQTLGTARAGERCATASARCWTGWAAPANRRAAGRRETKPSAVQGRGDRPAGAADFPAVCGAWSGLLIAAASPAHRPLPGMVRGAGSAGPGDAGGGRLAAGRAGAEPAAHAAAGSAAAGHRRPRRRHPARRQPDADRASRPAVAGARARRRRCCHRRTGLPILVTGGSAARRSSHRSPR